MFLIHNIKVVKAIVKSDHCAIVACCSGKLPRLGKSSTESIVRQCTPQNNYVFLQHGHEIDFEPMYRDCVYLPDMSVDRFYNIMLSALGQFFPTKQITLTSDEPYFVTLKMKLLRTQKKNKLMQLGRQQEADTIAAQAH